MQRLTTILLSIPIAYFAFAEEPASKAVTPVRESMLPIDDACSPVPSPDGTKIAYVHTGTGEKGGEGRGSLRSEFHVMTADGKHLGALRGMFISGWTADGKSVACFRDWQCCLVSPDGIKSKESTIPERSNRFTRRERAVYLPRLDSMAWMRHDEIGSHVDTSKEEVSAYYKEEYGKRPGDLMAPSPDGRYLAVVGSEIDSNLWILDFDSKQWTDFGKAVVHPSKNWEWAKPPWTPWSSDGSKLVYFSEGKLILASPDGKTKETVTKIDGAAALPAVSPNGKQIAFVTFDAPDEKDRYHWGGTSIWVVAAKADSIPRRVTEKSRESTFCLRWLNDETAVFDRITSKWFFVGSRIWKVPVDERKP